MKSLRSKAKETLLSSKVAVCIPCLNEESTVAEVVQAFRKNLPQAKVYVFDNASTDQTVRAARKAGAVVVPSPVRGKGNVVRDIFQKMEADWIIMVDGDATYDAAAAPRLLRAAIDQEIDMLVGKRCTPDEESSRAYRPMHQLGNRMVCGLIRSAFRVPLQDVFSGYRIFSRVFTKTIPLRSGGFEVETELTLQAISKSFTVMEMETAYKARPPGSFSKLNTYRDGMLVLSSFLAICRFYRPMLFFGTCGLFLGGLSLLAGAAPILDYLNYRWVYRVPLAILATGLAILSSLSFLIGLILETQLKYHNESFNLIRNNLKGWRKSFL